MLAITLLKVFMANDSYSKVGWGNKKVPLNFIVVERFVENSIKF